MTDEKIEIEITQKMIEAGAAVLDDLRGYALYETCGSKLIEEIVIDVYRAIAVLSPS